MKESPIVAKFGGTALADAEQVRKVIQIIRDDRGRRYIVPSAPKGVTDQLCDLYKAYGTLDADQLRDLYKTYGVTDTGNLRREILRRISEKFHEIMIGLQVRQRLDPYLRIIASKASRRDSGPDFVASRGEFIMAKILAEALGYTFVDAEDIIRFDSFGNLDMKATEKNLRYIQGLTGCVIPGFYGAEQHGTLKIVRTLPRDGSDITGAVIAKLMGIKLYEKWTQGVPGVCRADREIVPDARKIDAMTFKEMRELSYSGASVLQDSVIPILQNLDIRIHVRDTDHPKDTGTMICPEQDSAQNIAGLIGIAGKKDFTFFTLDKALMNEEVGFEKRVLAVFEDLKISTENTPGVVDTKEVIVKTEAILGKIDIIREALVRACNPDSIMISHKQALISVVGHKLKKSSLFLAFESEDIPNRVIGENDISLIVRVENGDYERATRAIYHAFVK